MIPLVKSNLLITGLVKNCEKNIIQDLERISKAFSIAKNVNFLLIESDSNDNSINILHALKEVNSNFDFITLGNLAQQFPLRTDRIAQCRNVYVEQIKSNSKYKEINYVAVVDLDGLITDIDSESILSCWNYDNWSAMTANQRAPYYDVWALRHDLWSPNDCWKQYEFFNLYNSSFQDNLHTSIYCKMLQIPEDSPIIKVNSAFGGLAIYIKSIFDTCHYNGLTENGEEICEHIFFNDLINKVNGNIFINPKLINAGYTEHTSHLANKSPNILINSKFGKIIIDQNDKYIGKHIIEKGYWAEEDIEIILNLLKIQLSRKDSLVFYDVGANIGTHSLAIAKTFGSQIKIRAFEAQRMIFNMLCGSVALGGYLNIYCHNAAVSDMNGDLIEIKIPDYYQSNNFGGHELISPLISDNQDMISNGSDFISTITLDSFNEKIDFIKMDIEGMEDKALKGAMKTIEISRPICFIEIHKTDFSFILNSLKCLNYTGYKSGMDLIAIPIEFNIEINGLDRYF
jgi:FkbM family methyltransferase